MTAAPRHHYKDTALFARYLAIGNAAEAAVVRSMARRGHSLIYRGAGAGEQRIWSDPSRKGRRKPDLVCERCGLRVEVKGKTRAMFALSDGAGRAFDDSSKELAGGDLVAFVQMREAADGWRAIAGYYVQVAALSAARPLAIIQPVKDASRGAEHWIQWPTFAPTVSGVVSAIDSGGMTIDTLRRAVRLSAPRNAPIWYVGIGQRVQSGVGLLAGCVPIMQDDDLMCGGVTCSTASMR